MRENKNKTRNKYAQLLAISSQMAACVLGCAIVGYFLDNRYEVEKNYFTLGLTLFGVFVGLYLLMKGVKNLNQ